MDRKGDRGSAQRSRALQPRRRPPNALERSAVSGRAFASHAATARGGSSASFDPGYHGASPYMRSEPVDIIFDSDFAKFDKSTGTYKCSVPSTFRGQRVDIVQLSSCSLDINSPNSDEIQGDGEETAATDTPGADSNDEIVDDIENGVQVMPERVAPPTLYFEREVRYFERSNTGSSLYRLRPLFGGCLTVHNRQNRRSYNIFFPKEYIIGSIERDTTDTSKGIFSCLSGNLSDSEKHQLTEYDIKNRILNIQGLPSSGWTLASAWQSGTENWGDQKDSNNNLILGNQLKIPFQNTSATTDKYIVCVHLRPFRGHSEVCTRINAALSSISAGIFFQYSGRNGRYTVGPEQVFIPDTQLREDGGSLFGKSVCDCLGIVAGQSGGPDLKTSIPPTIRSTRVIIAQGAAPIAYALQSGDHLRSEIRKVYGRLDGRMGIDNATLTVRHLSSTQPDGSNASDINIDLGTIPFKNAESMAVKIQSLLEAGAGSDYKGWTSAYDSNSKRVQIKSPGGSIPFQIVGMIRTGSVATSSTSQGTFMVGAQVNPLLPRGYLPFGSGTFRGLPLRSPLDPRFGVMHLYQEHAELRESTVAVVTGKVPIPVSTVTNNSIENSVLQQIDFGVSAPFNRGDLVEAFDEKGKLIDTRYIVAKDTDTKVTLLPLSILSSPPTIKFIRQLVVDDSNRYNSCITSHGTSIFVNESDRGRPGPSLEDTPQPVLSFSARSLGAAVPIGIQVALNRSPNMTRHSCSPDVETVYVRLCHSNVCTNKVPSLPNDLGRASGILGRITNSAGLRMDRSLSGSASFPGGTRLPPELEFQFLDQSGQIIRSGLKRWSLSLTIPNVTLNLDRA